MKTITKVTMRKLCLLLTLIISTSLAKAQFLGDTVLLFIDASVELKFAVADFEELKTSQNVEVVLQQFKNFIPAIEDNLSANEAELVKFHVGGELTIEPGDDKIIFLNNEDHLSNTGIRDRAVLYGENFTIFIATTDMTLLKDLDLIGCVGKMKAQFPNGIRWSKTISYECSNGEVRQIEQKNNEFDMLEIQFGAGAGLIKSRWVADLSLGLNLLFNHKGIPRGPYISSNMIFDFDAENKMNLNTFLNLGYSFNIGNKNEKPNMLGVEVGYLISKQGDLFGDNTLKFGVNWSPVKLVNVSPQLFVTDNFKQAFPGIRIGFGF